MSDDEPRESAKPPPLPAQIAMDPRAKYGPLGWFKSMLRGKVSNTNVLEDALDDYIDELKETQQDEASADSQKTLIKNVLRTHSLQVADVMIPRADIIAISEDATPEDLKTIFSEKQYSRIPVYRGKLDHIIGTIHIKDILACMLIEKPFTLGELVREPIIVSPSLPLMELFLMMRQDKKHMALVVDEFGGIDGLVTLNDVIEAFVGDIEDEFDHDDEPQVIEKPDGSVIVEGRMDIDDFEERYGNFLTNDEREDIQTLGGLAFSIAGRVPKRGEILKHSSGSSLEIIEADKRRVGKMRIRDLQSRMANDEV